MVNVKTGDEFKIVSTKHNGKLHRSWERNTMMSYEDGVIIGGNYETLVSEANGKVWCTTEPALFYFTAHHWFNVIIVFEKEDHFYYCNISSPCKWKHDELHYIDYDIDIIVRSDYTYDIVDEDEFFENKQIYRYPDDVQTETLQAIEQLILLIETRKEPFTPSFINKWRTAIDRLIEK